MKNVIWFMFWTLLGSVAAQYFIGDGINYTSLARLAITELLTIALWEMIR